MTLGNITSLARTRSLSPLALRPSLLALLLLATLTACGGRGVEQIHVSGKVTLDGGPMPATGTLYFTPTKAGEGATLRPGRASFDTSGNYSAGSFDAGDGLFPGSYTVSVECWKVSPNMEGVVGVSHLPEKYTNGSTSGLTVEVPAGSGSITKDFELVSTPK